MVLIGFGNNIKVYITIIFRYLEVEYYLEKQQYPRARIEVLVFSLLVLVNFYYNTEIIIILNYFEKKGMGISILVIVIITTKYIPLPTISIIP